MRRWLKTVWFFVLLAVIQPAWSEEKEKDKKTSPISTETVYVFARKRLETFNQVPVSVDVYSATDLSDAGITNIDDLALFVPGFSFEKTFGRQLDRPVIRGQSTILSGTQIEQNVAFYIDGVFVSGAISATTFMNIERIEVMKGPQNALFGRAAFSGAINIITRKPGDKFEGQVTATAAVHDEYRLNVNASGPIVPGKLSLQVGGSHYEYGGEYRNIHTRLNVGGENTDAVSATFFFTPTSFFNANLTVMFSNDEDQHNPSRLQDSSFNNCFLDTFDQYYCGEVNVFPEVSLNTDSVGGGGLQRETWRVALTTNANLGNLILTTITAFNDETLDAGLDQDGTSFEPIESIPPLKGSFQTLDTTTFRDFSQEIRLTSSDIARFRWLFGVYFFHREHSGTNFLPNPGLKPITKTQNIATFGQMQFDFTDHVTGTVDLRFGRDRKTLLLPDGTFIARNYSSFDPRFTLDYHPSDNRLYYISVAKGSKPGGFNPRVELPPELRTFDQERAWNFEAGVKRVFPASDINIHGAVYYIRWINQQLTNSFQPSAGRPLVFTENAGRTRVLGAEVSLRARPSFTWEFVLTYAFNDAEFIVFDVPEQAALTGDPSVAGNKTPRSPRHMGTLAAVYRIPVPIGNFFIRPDLLFESKRFAQVHNLAHTGDRIIFNLHAGLETENFTVSVWVKNMFDDRTAVSITRFRDFAGLDSFSAPRAFNITLARGRQIGMTVSHDF